MSWRDVLSGGGRTWEAVVEYARERVALHERILRSRAASVEDLRASQAALDELDRLINLRAELADEAKARSKR